MIIAFGDIQLITLEASHLEMVRNWRNSPHIVSKMDHQEYISETAQIKWFNSIDHSKNTYFVIQYAQQLYGLIHLANINLNQYSAESGLFIGIPNAIGSPIPMLASISLLEFAFGALRLNRVFAKVAQHNQKAIQYNKWLGFKYLEPISSGFDRYVAEQDSYYQQRDQRLTMFKLSDQIIEITIRSGNALDTEMAKNLNPSKHWVLVNS
jgi:RimJ/RimL family protein N-acetyltransferase